jgi:hypothetical protein
MKVIVAIACSIVFALILVFASSSLTSACELIGADSEQCLMVKIRRTPIPTKVAAAKEAPTPTAMPKAVVQHGTYPADGMEPTDTWQTIAPNSSLWFKIGGGINPQHFDVWLDTHNQDGVNFAVYSPEQYQDISTGVPPKGRGSANKSDLRHDLWWIGQSPVGGTWYILLTNKTPMAVAYKLGYNRVETPRKKCDSYWEPLGGSDVYWTACN